MDRERLARASILVADDSDSNVALLARLLQREGYQQVTTITDPQEVVRQFLETSPDLLILDLHMPVMDGFAVMQALRPHIPSDAYLPILVVTGDEGTEARHKALAMGAKDFLNKPYDRTEILLRVRNLLESRFLHMELQVQNVVLEAKVAERTKGLERALGELERFNTDLRLSQEETVKRLAAAAELRDDDTGQHVHRMSRYCAVLAQRVGLAEERVELIRLAAQMHDVGKIGIPDAILLKPGPLDDEERATIQQHSRIGHEILRDSPSELLALGGTIALTHHERVDGAGYPQGLRGDEIPIEGRMAAIADVFDSLNSDRVYRKAFPLDRALDMMQEGRGTHFDPYLLDVFLGSLDDILAIRSTYLQSAASSG